MITYQRFRREWMSWRLSDFGKLGDIRDVTELPYGSVVHILDNFPMDGKVSFGPRIDNHFINMNNFKVYMLNESSWPTKTSPAPINKEKVIMTSAGVMSGLTQYRKMMMPRVMYVQDAESFPSRAGITNVVNWNPYFRARCMGVRRKIRFFNLLYSSLINRIASMPEKMHFIHIPLENYVFEKQHFLRVFKKFSPISVLFPENSSYIFLAHLYALLATPMSLPKRGVSLEESETKDAGTESLAELVGEEGFTASPEEILQILKGSIEAECGMEALNEFPYNHSIFEYLPKPMFEKVCFIFTAGDKYVCYNLRDLKELNGSAGIGLLKFIANINNLVRTAYAENAIDNIEVSEAPVAPESVTNIEAGGSNAPTFTKVRTHSERLDAAEADVLELDDVSKILTNMPDASAAQKARVEKLSKTYKHLKIDGEEFGKLMLTLPDDKLEPPEVETAATDAGVIDKSATRSTSGSLSKTYIGTRLKQDIANIVTSFNKQGMFLVDFDQKEILDDLNRLTVYTATFEDTEHKKHRVPIPVPIPDKNGRIKVNGVTKMMRLQRVNKPIVKVSPTRVTLNTNYNKALVERNMNVSHSFIDWFSRKTINKVAREGFKVVPSNGICKLPKDHAIPFEISELGTRYHSIGFEDRMGVKGMLYFDYLNRKNEIVSDEVTDMFTFWEKENGCVWFGYRNGKTDQDAGVHFFITLDGTVTAVDLDTKEEQFCGAFGDFFEWLTGVPQVQCVEYIDITFLSKTLPLIHFLAYRYGLTNMLKYCNCDYSLYDLNQKFEKRPSDIIIKFADKRLVISRVPRTNALLFGGLTAFDLEDVYYDDMDGKDIYYQLLEQKKLTYNSIKGIDSFFDLFIDPITKDVLRDMNEPTDIRDLLLRCVTLLSTSDHINAASEANFRYRGVEQLTGIIYNEMARAFATYKNRSIGATNKFSLAEHTIKQRIIQDQLMEKVDTINPMEDIKDMSAFSGAGSGGRSSETFLVPDRKFTEDSLGIVSEATVDNGKTGMVAYLPANPTMVNARGITEKIPVDELKPENVFSFNTLLMPGVTYDD